MITIQIAAHISHVKHLSFDRQIYHKNIKFPDKA